MSCTGLVVPTTLAMSFTADALAVIRVLVVDDHDLYRTGLASLLEAQPDIEVVAQASGGRMGVRLAAELRPDVVLMDLRMPDLHGVEATRAIVEHEPSTRVVALTVSAEEPGVAATMQAGACGFVVKGDPVEQVIVAVRAAAQGATWLSPDAADLVLGHLRQAEYHPAIELEVELLLSPRERDVLRLIARGMENSEIADTLQISPRTVKNHVSSILSKLALPNRVQAAIYAVRHGMT